MAQTLYISMSNGDVLPIQGVSGAPTQVDITVKSGWYRDIYSGASEDELYFAGTAGDPTEEPISIASPPYVSGGIFPRGDDDNNAVIDQEDSDPESRVQIPKFGVTASDEFAHAPLRQVEYIISFWVFSTIVDGSTVPMYFRQDLVRGWSNLNPNTI